VKILVVLALLAAVACEREDRSFRSPPPATGRSPAPTLSALTPGPGPSGAPPGNPYDESAYAVSEGKRLYEWFNCVGCHAHGGGGMGPALIDDQWIYGDAPANIYATIVEGRPNGMPSFRGKIPDDQIWEIVAYVRSLGGLVRGDVASGRDDHLHGKSSEQASPGQPPQQAFVPPASQEQTR